MKKKRIFAGIFAAAMTISYASPSLISHESYSELIATAYADAHAVNIWWPAQSSALSGTQPFKAVLSDKSVTDYTMYWQVDGGGLVSMYDSYQDYPHKEAIVNVDSWKWSSTGSYTLAFIAKDLQGNEIGRSQITINANVPATSAPISTPTPIVVPIVPVAPVLPSQTSKLYVDPAHPALSQAASWASSRPQDATVMQKIAGQSTAKWFGGWNTDVAADVSAVVKAAASQNAIPTLVAYNIPVRDCGSYSAGGASSIASYQAWIQKFSNGIGSSKAIVILEPDALASANCLSFQMKVDRFGMIKSAVAVFKANNPNTKVYIDAGHAQWIDPSDMAQRLSSSGIDSASGFALNVSNFYSTSDNTAYGQKISALTRNAHFVIDTSRNGAGSNGDWCNPQGRALGQAPTLSTGNPLIDAYLWVKVPGESDGNCNGGPSAGAWWPEYALSLAKSAGY
ncbi:MAG: glycoside hydrolase family 6 protein [Patescibacteria group bacterium]